jgi:hypothetical protein
MQWLSNIIPDKRRFLQEKNFPARDFFLMRILIQCSGLRKARSDRGGGNALKGR